MLNFVGQYMGQIDLKALTTHLRKAREKKNYTQEYLGQQLGIGQNAYSKLEAGSTSLTVEQLMRIAELLDLDMRELLRQIRYKA